MSITNDDYDDDMAKPYNVDFGSDDTDDDLADDLDEVNWSIWGMQ